MNLKRNNKQYMDVENFEEYEFTPCIAYEMAIRNPRVVEITIKSFVNSHKKHTGNKKLDKELLIEEEELFIEYGIAGEFYYKYHFLEEANDIFHKNHKSSDGQLSEKQYKETHDDIEVKKLEELDGFFRHTHLSKDSEIPYYESHAIIPNFKRPRMYVYEFDTEAEVRIDFSKPENELIAYIKHLKKAYNRNLLDSPYDEFIQYISKKSDKKGLPKGTVMADIFYIYDSLKLGYSKRKIQNEVYNYYADKGIETRTLDYKTLKKYHDIAIDYIDNKRYLELVTGKKLEELQIRNSKK